MHTKDYVTIAAAFKRAVDFAETTGDRKARDTVMWLVADLATEFKAENPRFDKTAFFRACGASF